VILGENEMDARLWLRCDFDSDDSYQAIDGSTAAGSDGCIVIDSNTGV
jgi:hypothetical protein